MTESTGDSQLNSTLQRLDSTLEQQTATAISGLRLPSFSGLADEDIYDFIGQFKATTFALSEKHRCLALNRCLTGVANTWAKSNIKKHIINGEWKPIKAALIQRFGPADITVKNREILSNMKFEEAQNQTLIGYVEKYMAQYSKAYKSHEPADAIISLRLNLPANLIRSLNLLDDNWSTYTNNEQLFKLIKRYEDHIKPYEKPEEKPMAVLDQEGIKGLLTELRKEITNQLHSKELLGAINAAQQTSKPLNQDKYRYHTKPNNPTKPYLGKRSWQSPNKPRYHSNQITRYKQPRYDGSNKPEHQVKPVEIEENHRQINYDSNRKPPGPCYFCKEDHWNRDCPRRNGHLN